MTEPSFPTLSVIPVFEDFPLKAQYNWGLIEVPTASGHRDSRARHSRYLREWWLICKWLKEEDWDKLNGFFFELLGGAIDFYMTNRHSYVPSPYAAATTSSAAGGSRGADTVYVQYTYSDGTNETRGNTETSQAVGANEYLSVTVKNFPPGATQANIYVGTTTALAKLVSKITTSGGTWTEVETAVDDDSNSGQKVLKVAATTGYAVGDQIVIDKENDGGGTEYGEVDTIQDGVSLTLVDNLTNNHTGVRADTVNHAWDQGASVPTSNTLEEEIHVELVDPLDPTKFSYDLTSLSLHLREVP